MISRFQGQDGKPRLVTALRSQQIVQDEEPLAAALVTGIVSVLKGLKVRNDLAMTGEITILGKVLPVGGIQQKLLAAYEAGVKEVLIPAENLNDTAVLPAVAKDKLKLTPVTRVEEVLKSALLPAQP